MLRWSAGAAGALLVLAVGKWIASRQQPALAVQAADVDLVRPAAPAATGPVGSFQRILLAVDGSDNAQRAVQQTLAMRQALRDPAAMEVQLLNVQRGVTREVSSYVAPETLGEYHRERAEEALAQARAALRAAGCRFAEHLRVGDPGPVIAEVAQAQGCDLIVMGTRGLGSASAALLGSVAQGVLEHASMPVLLAK
jgi:nucleotide-binding universal stress UspA family protein